MKSLLKRTFRFMGLEIRRASNGSTTSAPKPDWFDEVFQIVDKQTMVPREGLKSLYGQMRFCDSIDLPGAYVECGVWKGGSVAVAALANLRHGKARRDLHLFDSFDDLCEPDATVDGERAVREVQESRTENVTQGRLKPVKGIYDRFGGHGTIRECERLLDRIGYDPARLHYHKGWFQDTVPVDAPRIQDIAILRLDGDLYASTKVCIEHLFKKVVNGGFVIIDDYGAYEGCQKAVDEFLAKAGRPVFLHSVNSEIRYIVKP